ncbi:hypothetical protein HRbin29_01184 [bacterium HR29]|jgi:DNA-binding MarR family transcriptional regulator|nr:hypothetical protein HRbin29_01184 [bacterium HR29]
MPEDSVRPDILSVLLHLARAVESAMRWSLQGLGLTPAQAETLRFIATTRPDVATVGWLAKTLGVRHATAVGILEPLVERGLVERHPHPWDGRQSVLALTPAGAELAERLRAAEEALLEVVDARSEEERACIERGLQALVRAMVDAGLIVVAAPCAGCAHFRPNAHGPGRHHCALIDRELPDEQSRLNCPEHEPALAGV